MTAAATSTVSVDKLRKQRTFLGLCIDCAQPKDETRKPFLRCTPCAAKGSTASTHFKRLERKALRVKGLCIDCKAVRSVSLRCVGCAAKSTATTQHRIGQLKEAHICGGCRADLVNTEYATCPSCRAAAAIRYAESPDKFKASVRRRTWEIKRTLFAHYGSKCVQCPETRLPCLDLDHINEDGADHRESLGLPRYLGGRAFYLRLLNSGEFPIDLQILCSNCHRMKHSKYEDVNGSD